jgi:hypothetical protein
LVGGGVTTAGVAKVTVSRQGGPTATVGVKRGVFAIGPSLGLTPSANLDFVAH